MNVEPPPPGTVLIDAAAWGEQMARVKALEQAVRGVEQENRDVSLTVRWTPAEMAAIDRIARAEGRSRGDAIRRLIQEALDAREPPDVLRKACDDGKIDPLRLPDWIRMWNADPVGTKQIIDNMTRSRP